MSAELWVVGVGAALAGLIVNGQISVGRRMERLEDGLSKLRTDLENGMSKLRDDMENGMSRVRDDVAGLRERLTRVEGALDVLGGRVTRVEGVLDRMSDTIAGRRVEKVD